MPHTPIALPAIMDIAACSALGPAFHDRMIASNPLVVVDAGAVERISTPGIQLLLSVFKTADAQGKHIEFSKTSGHVLAAFEDFGLLPVYQSHVAGG